MRRQYDLHPKEPNKRKRPMHVPTTTADPPAKARLHQVRLVILFFVL
jgi:hypothetical protein